MSTILDVPNLRVVRNVDNSYTVEFFSQPLRVPATNASTVDGTLNLVVEQDVTVSRITGRIRVIRITGSTGRANIVLFDTTLTLIFRSFGLNVEIAPAEALGLLVRVPEIVRSVGNIGLVVDKDPRTINTQVVATIERPIELFLRILRIEITDPKIQAAIKFLDVGGFEGRIAVVDTGNFDGFTIAITTFLNTPTVEDPSGLSEIEKALYPILKALSDTIPGVALTGSYNIDVINRSNSFAGIEHRINTNVDIFGYQVTGLVLGVQGTAAPSIELIIGMDIVPPPPPGGTSTTLEFRGQIGFGETSIAIGMSLSGEWVQPLGIPQVTVKNLGFGFDKLYSSLATLPGLFTGAGTLPAFLNAVKPDGLRLTGNVAIAPLGGGDPLSIMGTLIPTSDIKNIAIEAFLDTGTYSSLGKVGNELFRLFSPVTLPADLFATLNLFELERFGFKFVPLGSFVGDINIDRGIGFEVVTRFNSPVVDGQFGLVGKVEIPTEVLLRGLFPTVNIPGVLEIAGVDASGQKAPQPELIVDLALGAPQNSRIGLNGLITIVDSISARSFVSITLSGIRASFEQSALGTNPAKISYDVEGALIENPRIRVAGRVDNSGSLIANAQDTLATRLQNAAAETGQQVLTSLQDEIRQAEEAYERENTRLYSQLTPEYLNSQIATLEGQVRDLLNNTLANVINNATARVNAERTRDTALAELNATRTRLNNLLNANGYGNININNLSSEIANRERARAQTNNLAERKSQLRQQAIENIRVALPCNIPVNFRDCRDAIDNAFPIRSCNFSCGFFDVGCRIREAACNTARLADAAAREVARGACEASNLAAKVAARARQECIDRREQLVNAIDGDPWLIGAIAAAEAEYNRTIAALDSALNFLKGSVLSVYNVVQSVFADAEAAVNRLPATFEELVREAKQTRDRITAIVGELVRLYLIRSIQTPISVAPLRSIGAPAVPILQEVVNVLGRLRQVAPGIFDVSLTVDVSRIVQSVLSAVSGSVTTPIPQVVPISDIQLSFSQVYAILYFGGDNFDIIVRYLLAQALKGVSNVAALGLFSLRDSATVQQVFNSVLSSGNVATVSIGGISIPTPGAIAKYIAENITVRRFDFEGIVSKEEATVSVKAPYEVVLPFTTLTVQPYTINLKRVFISILESLLNEIVKLFK